MTPDKPKPAKAPATPGQGPSKSSAAGVPATPKPPVPGQPSAPKAPAPLAGPLPPLFRRVDWLAFGLTALLVFIGYYLTLAPDLTLEDSGELAVGSFYAGVPHPPGYPVWTLYTWLFTLLPVSNIAYRVAISSAVAGAIASGLLGLMVSRGSSMMLEGVAEFKTIERRWENLICLVSGFVAGMLMGFNGFMWSQAVIVEVYTLSVLSLTGVLCCLLRWLYAPSQRRYLYLGFFLFGICFNNHQSLIVAAMAIEVAVTAVQAKLGRDLILGNVIFYLLGLVANLSVLQGNVPLQTIFHVIGLGSIAACAWLTIKTKKLFTEWKSCFLSLGAFLLGASFYLYMAVASMSNPPMNWGYPRTVAGFIHAFTRGQYERIHPTAGVGNTTLEVLGSFFSRFAGQVLLLKDGVVLEFSWVYILIGLIPFLFFTRLQARERAWIIGLSAFYFVLGPGLLILLNPATDRQSLDLNKPFFTASHVLIAMAIGYGLTLLGGTLLTQYQKFRFWILGGIAVAVAFALYALTDTLSKFFGDQSASGIGLLFKSTGQAFALGQDRPEVYAAYLLLALTFGFMLLVLFCRTKINLPVVLGLFAILPANSILSHWADNEQRGHRFGYWFGHDMFTPPFQGPDGKLSYDPKLRAEMMKGPQGKLIYPEMARDTILFGGTDPGRFAPTYMIFCESFIPPSKKPNDPNFDRRDVYIITQNALADGTYLSYIRAHYNRSTQIDPPFFQEVFRSAKEQELNYTTNLLARLVSPLDTLFLSLGSKIEERRRKDGVYPRVEIHTPTPEDSTKAFQEYLEDAQRRLKLNQLKPGEDVKVIENRVQVSGQVAVMAINGLLTKIIFDKNPTNEFYVEESFPLEWMYPYLTPFGIIMKINRQPVPELTDEIVERDHHFWSAFSDRLIGNWITYDTPISNICQFAEKTYLHQNYQGFQGDPKFVRDNDGQKAFSKLRSSIAGVYAWRVDNAKTDAERRRAIREAEFAFKQAYAFCPFSPEALFRYVNLLVTSLSRVGENRIDDARLLAATSFKLDPYNAQLESLVKQLDQIKKQQGNFAGIPKLEQEFQTNPGNMQAAYSLVSAYAQIQNTSGVSKVADQVLANPNVNPQGVLFAAQIYQQLGQVPKIEGALEKLVKLQPTNPEAWYDLAAIQAMLSKNDACLQTLGKSIHLSAERIAKDPKASNLILQAKNDDRFLALRALPDFQTLLTPK